MANSVAEILGRKKSTLIDCLAFLIGFIVYGMGENVATLIVARVFLGYPLINTVRWCRAGEDDFFKDLQG